jgi:hypothetical protein
VQGQGVLTGRVSPTEHEVAAVDPTKLVVGREHEDSRMTVSRYVPPADGRALVRPHES